ncbi:ATP-binding protein [Enterobacter hormaechei]|uniref:ATP-binding protein n=1 Tax=Enterobacter hormaechei TaxID=158836 RepID=UPI0032B0A338
MEDIKNKEDISPSTEVRLFTSTMKKTSKVHPNERRLHCVSVRLNKKELEKIEELRGRYRRGEWLRMVSLSKLPPLIPEINKDVWIMLGEISQKLNRLIVHLDSKTCDSPLTKTEAFAVKKQLHELRLSLITSRP